MEKLASSGIRVRSPWAGYNLTNDPNEYIQQIDKNFITIDPSEHVNSMKTVQTGEAAELQSRIYFDNLIRSNYTDELGSNVQNVEKKFNIQL